VPAAERGRPTCVAPRLKLERNAFHRELILVQVRDPDRGATGPSAAIAAIAAVPPFATSTTVPILPGCIPSRAPLAAMGG
jgi:hypothetical protein